MNLLGLIPTVFRIPAPRRFNECDRDSSTIRRTSPLQNVVQHMGVSKVITPFNPLSGTCGALTLGVEIQPVFIGKCLKRWREAKLKRVTDYLA